MGGGIVFGPTTERNYDLKVNRRAKRLAFNSALTLKAKDEAVVIHEFKMEKPSTKAFMNALQALKLPERFQKILVVSEDETTFLAGRNLPYVIVNKLAGLTVEMIVNADVVILAPTHISALESLAKGVKRER